VCQMTGLSEIDACYEMVTENGAKTLNLGEDYGIAVGRPANLIVLDAVSPYEAIRQRATVEVVISNGQILAETAPRNTLWHGPETVAVNI